MALGAKALKSAAAAACVQAVADKPRSVHQVGAFQPLRRTEIVVLYVGALRVTRPETSAWHPVYALPKMAAGHASLCDVAVRDLREWLITGDAVFDFLPTTFSLRELQDVWQAVLGESVDKRNFRRKVLGEGWVESVAADTSDAHRSGTQLYRAARG